jgi:hypothetical protein
MMEHGVPMTPQHPILPNSNRLRLHPAPRVRFAHALDGHRMTIGFSAMHPSLPPAKLGRDCSAITAICRFSEKKLSPKFPPRMQPFYFHAMLSLDRARAPEIL